MPRLPILLPLVLSIAACGSGGPHDGQQQGAANSPAASSVSVSASAGGANTTATAQSSSNGGREIEEKTELYSFEYSYPAQAGAIPGLKAMLDTRLEKEKDQLKTDTRAAKKEADSAGFPYRAYEADTAWDVVADLPDWLSLSAQIYTYTGGAHGNHGFDVLLWDRKAGVLREPLSLFVSTSALNAAVKQDFCAALNRKRAKKRGEPVKPGSTDPFDECISIKDTTVILGSANRKTFDRIGFLIGPYAAGPYAEGDYEVTLPVTKAALALVKPEYRASFSLGR